MMKLIALAAMVVLAFTFSGVASATCTIQGHVYFEEPDSIPAPCADVYLYSGDDCQIEVAMTTTDENGFYEFTGLQQGNYSMKVVWGFTVCVHCTPEGSECDPMTTDCTDISVVGDMWEDIFLGINCWCA